jgi:hypothetical protein
MPQQTATHAKQERCERERPMPSPPTARQGYVLLPQIMCPHTQLLKHDTPK